MTKFFYGICVGIIIGALALVTGVMVASAQESVQTTVTVVIQDEISSGQILATSTSVSAAVPCNEVNCTKEEDAPGIVQRIINWFKNLI